MYMEEGWGGAFIIIIIISRSLISSLPHVKVPGEGHERHRGGPDAEACGPGALQGLQGAGPLHATLRGLHHRSRGGH